MALIPLILDLGLERGKCYTLSGTLSGLGVGEEVLFQIGNETTQHDLLQTSSNGAFTVDFDYTTSQTFFKTLYVTETGDFDITDFSLKLDATCQTEYCSECFKLTDCYECELLTLKWTNNRDAYGFNYTALPLIQTLTIKGGLRNADYPYDEEYFTSSPGSHFPVYVDSIKTIELWVHDVPTYIHDALRLGIVHSDFRIDDVNYSKADGGYSPDWDTPNSLLAPVIVKLREQFQNTKNKQC